MDQIRRARLEVMVWKALEIYDKLGEEEGMKIFEDLEIMEKPSTPSALQKDSHRIYSIFKQHFEDKKKVQDLVVKFWKSKASALRTLSVLLLGELAGSDLNQLQSLKERLKDENPEIRDAAQLALRAPLRSEPEKMLKEFSNWISDKDEYLRKAAVECLNPYADKVLTIEWLRENPEPILKVLSKLKKEKSMPVKKAVVSNLSDISKNHPELVLKTLKDWLSSGDDNTKWIAERVQKTLEKSSKKEVEEQRPPTGKTGST